MYYVDLYAKQVVVPTTLGPSILQYRADHLASGAGAVKFAEKNILPGGQAQVATDNGYGFRRSNQARLQMCIPVAILLVVQPDPMGNDLAQKIDHIGLHAFIPVFLDHHRSGGPLDIDADDAILDAAAGDDPLHPIGNIDQDFPPVCRHADNLSQDLILFVVT